MSNTFLGLGVNFGIAGTTAITGTGIGTFKLQSQEHKKSAEKEVIKNEDGIDCQATLFNPTEEATFEYVVSGALLADAVSATKIPEIGQIVTVANAAQYPGLASAAWFVWDDPMIKGSNTGAMRVTLHLKRWKGTGGIVAGST